MATQTPNRSYEKPDVGGDDDIWGGLTNQNWDQLDTEIQQLLDAILPIGMIVAWYGAIADIPDNWGLCDGSVYTRTDGGGTIQAPNLTGRFIVAATGDGTGDHPVGQTDDYDGSGSGADYYALAYVMKH